MRTTDALLGGRLTLTQPARGPRAGADAVFLAAAVPARAGERALELGCGSGAAALCLAWRVAGLDVTGLELQPELAELAATNADANGLGPRLRILAGDLRRPPATLKPGSFHHVLANPPFFVAGRHDVAPQPARALSRAETGGAVLADWVAAALKFARSGGTLTFILRAERLDELLALLRGRAGSVVFPFWPAAGRPAKLVLVQARKGARTPLCLSPGLVLHGPGGGYTAAADDVLRRGEALRLQVAG